jgi:hypothetical protein
VKDGSLLQVGVPAKGGGAGYTQMYTRQQDLSVEGGVPTAPMTQIPYGTWKSADGNDRTLVIGTDGSVSFTAYANTAKEYTGTGSIDADFPTGARAAIDCATGTAKATPCGVFLIEQNTQTADEIVVYGSYGPETFIRTS